jgi:hypothetical protein
MRPAMQRLLDQLTQTPAIVLGKRMAILAWNPLATALYADFAQLPPARRNYVRLRRAPETRPARRPSSAWSSSTANSTSAPTGAPGPAGLGAMGCLGQAG